jgi:hypothetical protein
MAVKSIPQPIEQSKPAVVVPFHKPAPGASAQPGQTETVANTKPIRTVSLVIE